MATNRKYESGKQLAVACTAPATPSSGDPVLFGQRPGVALTDEDAAGLTTVQFDGVFDLSVQAVNNGGNSAVAAGDKLYYEAGQTPVLNKDNVSGVFFGYAKEAILEGATATIEVIVGY